MILSQAAYALFSVLRDPMHASIERGHHARRPAVPGAATTEDQGPAVLGPASPDDQEPAALQVWHSPATGPQFV